MQRRPAVAFVLIAVVIDVIGIGLIIPVLPRLVGEFTSNRETQTYWYGLLTVTFGLMQFLCAPLLGALSGEEAIYEVLEWSEGHFSFAPGDPGPGAPLGSGFSQLLLEGCRRLDERLRAAAAEPAAGGEGA